MVRDRRCIDRAVTERRGDRLIHRYLHSAARSIRSGSAAPPADPLGGRESDLVARHRGREQAHQSRLLGRGSGAPPAEPCPVRPGPAPPDDSMTRRPRELRDSSPEAPYGHRSGASSAATRQQRHRSRGRSPPDRTPLTADEGARERNGARAAHGTCHLTGTRDAARSRQWSEHERVVRDQTRRTAPRRVSTGKAMGVTNVILPLDQTTSHCNPETLQVIAQIRTTQRVCKTTVTKICL